MLYTRKAGCRMESGESGISIRIALDALREISNEQYPRLLKAAGVERFVANPPPATAEIVVSYGEWGALFYTVYTMLGADFLRLFGRNLATASLKPILTTPGTAQLRATVQARPADERLGFAVHVYAEMMS